MFRKLAHSLGLSSPEPPPSSVVAQMGKKAFKIEFEPEDFENKEKGATVGFLRSKIAEATSNPIDHITLVHSGRKLVEDDKYLLDYDVKTDAKILVIARKPRKTASKAAPVKPKTGKERVQEIVDAANTQLEELVKKFEDTPASDLTLEKAGEEHHRLNELVLQKMFALDDVDVSEDPELRQFRKDTINSMHSLHKRVDATYEAKKDELYSGESKHGEKGAVDADATENDKEDSDSKEDVKEAK